MRPSRFSPRTIGLFLREHRHRRTSANLNALISGTGGFAPEFIIVTSEKRKSILKVSFLDEKPRFLNGGEIKDRKDIYLTSDREPTELVMR